MLGKDHHVTLVLSIMTAGDKIFFVPNDDRE